MSTVTLDSHDLLGTLSIIKNYLSVVKDNPGISQQEKEYISRAFEANESLIALVKEKTRPDTPLSRTA